MSRLNSLELGRYLRHLGAATRQSRDDLVEQKHRIDEVETTPSRDDRVPPLAAEVDAVKARLTTIERDIGGLLDRVIALEGSVASLEVDMVEVLNRLDALEAAVPLRGGA